MNIDTARRLLFTPVEQYGHGKEVDVIPTQLGMWDTYYLLDEVACDKLNGHNKHIIESVHGFIETLALTNFNEQSNFLFSYCLTEFNNHYFWGVHQSIDCVRVNIWKDLEETDVQL